MLPDKKNCKFFTSDHWITLNFYRCNDDDPLPGQGCLLQKNASTAQCPCDGCSDYSPGKVTAKGRRKLPDKTKDFSVFFTS